MLKIGLLGPLEVHDGETPVALPPSRKTRLLLGYLATTMRPQRRERLCELFWDLPDDPRGALRWSLSRLRAALDRAGAQVVIADRDNVRLDLQPEQVDCLAVGDALKDGPDAASTTVLEAAAARFRGPFLADLDPPPNPELQSWLAATREEMRSLHAAVLATLVDRHAGQPERALPYARELVQLDPYAERSWARLIERLAALGRRREVEEQYAAAKAALAEVGGATQLLEAARAATAATSDTPQAAPPAADPVASEPHQEIRFCTAEDGVRLAYAVAGEGPPLVKSANWLNHLEYDWESPIWGHLLRNLSRRHRLLRYDSRGNGLSDRDVKDISFDLWVSDMKTVVDAAGYDRFPLFGISQGCAISIAFAVRYPERVSHLILYAGSAIGGYVVKDPEEVERRRAMNTLIRLGWGHDNPAFRQMFTSQFMPDAPREIAEAFNELQRRSATAEVAARQHDTSARVDVRPLLALVNVPTLVLHPVGDATAPVEGGRRMASKIPGARFVPLPGNSHLFLEHDPAAARFHEEVRRFLAE